MGDLTGYKVGAHRHVPEIKQAAGISSLTMTPVLAPMPRGILAVCSVDVPPVVATDHLRNALATAYDGEPFVRVLPEGRWPRTSSVTGSNAALIQAAVEPDTGRAVVAAVIDNLGKGAAGQAVQLANLVLGLDETAGLTTAGTAP
jgi:N-acetyl-gamma-glutamyl-phosphate reductase